MESVAGAVFDETGYAHRFKLWRKWNSAKPKVLFIMLNPSKGTADKNDPTITRLIKFAQNFNYGGFYIGNLFSYVSSYPEELVYLRPQEYLFEENNKHILEMAAECQDIVFAWGNEGQLHARDKDIIAMFPDAKCFKITNLGHPWHPLYLKGTTTLDSYAELMSYRNKRYKKESMETKKEEPTEKTVELTAEQVVEKELKKFNLADAEIAKLKEKYMVLKISGPDDKKGADEVSKARKDIKAKRVDVEKVRKREKDFYHKTGKAIDDEAKRITAQLTPIETYLEEEEARAEKEAQDAKLSEATKLLERTSTRMNQLAEFGAAMDFNQIQTMSDEDFAVELKAYEADYLLNPPKTGTVSFGGLTVEVPVGGPIKMDEEEPFQNMNAYEKITERKEKLKLNRRLVFFDVESTGLSWEKDEPIQIAIVSIMPDGKTSEWASYIRPMCGSIPPEITALTGITWEMVKDMPTFSELAGDIYKFLTDCDLAGYSIVGFDVPFLSQKFSNLGWLFPMLDQKFLDVANIYKKMNPRTLADAYRHYVGGPLENAHNAIADNYATLKVLEGQMHQHIEEIGNTVESISKFSMDGFVFVDAARKLSRDKDGNMIYNIGKYKGEKVSKFPDFADWMKAQPWITKHTIAMLDEELNPKPKQEKKKEEVIIPKEIPPVEPVIQTALVNAVESFTEDNLPI